MTFTESVSSDPDSFGTGAKLKETFDKLMQEAKQHLQATHMEKSRVSIMQLHIKVLVCVCVCVCVYELLHVHNLLTCCLLPYRQWRQW